MELTGIAFLYLTQMMRLDLGQKSNKTESTNGMLVFALFCLLSLGFYLYFGFYTTFVIVLDTIFGAMGLFFAGSEFLLALLAFISFRKN